MPASSGAVDVDGTAIHYLDWGPPPGGQAAAPPLMLLHATGFLAALWRPIAERLACRFRVIAVDQRGHGESDKPESGYTFEVFARDLQGVIEALELDRPLVAGHSSGASTIVLHAAGHPGVISRAVLIEPIMPRPDWYTAPPGGRTNMSLAEGARRRRAVWRDADEAFESYRTKDTFRSWREDVLRLYVEEGMRPREDGQMELKCPPEIEGQYFDAVRGPDFWSLAAQMQCPALLLWGGESHLLARGLDREAQAAIAQARTVVVAGTSHFLPQERPDEVARLLEEFLSD